MDPKQVTPQPVQIHIDYMWEDNWVWWIRKQSAVAIFNTTTAQYSNHVHILWTSCVFPFPAVNVMHFPILVFFTVCDRASELRIELWINLNCNPPFHGLLSCGPICTILGTAYDINIPKKSVKISSSYLYFMVSYGCEIQTRRKTSVVRHFKKVTQI
jgi:hypothetical protein